MTDFWHEKFHATIAELVACNDTGRFERAWKILGQLLNWKHLKASKYSSERTDERRERAGIP